METIEKQKTFRHCLLYYLDCSYRQYETLKYGYFLDWCEQVNREKRIVKRLEDLTGNDYLNNWFDDQWYYLVECSIERYYGKALREGIFDKADVELMITLSVDDIFRVYPKTILQLIEKSEKRKITVDETAIYGSAKA